MFQPGINIADIIRKRSPSPNRPYDSINEEEIANSKRFEPNTQAFDLLSQELSRMPQRNENPSIWRTIGGELIGMGAGLKPLGIVGGQPIGASFDPKMARESADQFIQKPYYDTMADIDKKVKMYEPMVESERSQNTINRQLFDAEENRKLARKTQERLEAKDEESARATGVREQQNERKLDTQNRLAEARVFAINNPDMKPIVAENGEIVFVNPKEPNKQVKTGIIGQDLSDVEKAELEHSNRMKEIEARKNASIEVKRVPSAGTGTGEDGMSATQRTADIQNKIKQAYETHPEWRAYMRINPNTNKYEIIPPKNSDMAILNKVSKFVYGEEMIRVMSPNGKTGTIRKSQLSGALKQGYKEIKGE